MPRPKLSKAEKRSEAVMVLLRPAEKKLLRKMAKQHKTSQGSLLRQAFLDSLPGRDKTPGTD